MRSVADFRGWAARQWRARWPAWLAGSGAPTGPGGRHAAGAAPRPWPLHPPTEAELAGDPGAVAAWVGEWQRFGATEGVTVTWVERSWRSFGTQRLPERVTASAPAIAGLAGEAGTWLRAVDAAARLRAAWPDAELDDAISAGARHLGKLVEADVVRLLAVLSWLAAHPDSGLWERELPVVGVHTKWVEQHRPLVEPLVAALTGRSGTGLRRTQVRFRVRLLDPALGNGPAEFSVDLPGLHRLEVRPRRVLICENATTISTLPDLPGTLAVHGMGFAAPVLAEVDWVRAADLWYWGDLDTYGFQILGQVRAALPEVRSALMDAATFTAYERLCVPEPRPFRGEIGHLAAAELAALALVRSGDRRLEQERIPRATATAALRLALG